MSAKANAGREALIGSLFMITSMAFFAVEDTFLKLATAELPKGQAVTMTGLIGMLIFAVLAFLNKQPLWTRAYVSPTMRVRAVFEIGGRLSYTLAFMLAPLLTATAILQATPLVVVAGAALFLGEPVGIRRWIAVIIGFVGVMLILRPWGAEFDMLTLLAVLGMLGFAGRDLATRASPPSLSNFQLGISGYLMLTIAGLLIWTADPRLVALNPHQALLLTIAISGGVFAYYALTTAMRRGDVASVTPWRYSRLIFGAAMGAFMFGESFDTMTLVGSVIVVGSGLFTLFRARRK